MWDKWNILLLLLMIVFSLGVYSAVGKQAPDFTLTDINGNEFSLSDYRGRVVLMDLFRMKPSCPPCIIAIPHFKGVYNTYSQNVLVIMSISVSTQDTDESLKRDFVKKHNIPWIVACGGTQIADQFNVYAVPTLVIVDAEGNMRFRHEGVTEESTLAAEIKSLLPPLAVFWPENKTYIATSVPLTFVLNETADWMGYSLDGRENVTVHGNTTLSDLNYGAHNVVVYSNSTLGVTYSDKVYFSNKPIAIFSPENKTYTTTSTPLSFAVSEAQSSIVSYSLDGAGNKTIKENITLTGLADGAHKVVVYFQDASGTTYSNEVHFTIDTTSTEDGDSDGGPWMSPQLIGITVVAVVFLLIVGVVVAGRVLQWSKPAKKRRVSK